MITLPVQRDRVTAGRWFINHTTPSTVLPRPHGLCVQGHLLLALGETEALEICARAGDPGRISSVCMNKAEARGIAVVGKEAWMSMWQDNDYLVNMRRFGNLTQSEFECKFTDAMHEHGLNIIFVDSLADYYASIDEPMLAEAAKGLQAEAITCE